MKTFYVEKEEDIYNIPENVRHLCIRCFIDFDEVNIELPQNLEGFYCNNIDATNLPKLPDKLKGLYCANNKLKNLPKLPEDLKYLVCWKNILVSLPELPLNLLMLECCDNNITYYPDLPKSLLYVDFDGNINYRYSDYYSPEIIRKHQQILKNLRLLFFKRQILRRIYRRRLINLVPLWRENSIIYNDILIKYFKF